MAVRNNKGTLPHGWRSHLDTASGNLYYENLSTHKVQWDRPSKTTMYKLSRSFLRATGALSPKRHVFPPSPQNISRNRAGSAPNNGSIGDTRSQAHTATSQPPEGWTDCSKTPSASTTPDCSPPPLISTTLRSRKVFNAVNVDSTSDSYSSGPYATDTSSRTTSSVYSSSSSHLTTSSTSTSTPTNAKPYSDTPYTGKQGGMTGGKNVLHSRYRGDTGYGTVSNRSDSISEMSNNVSGRGSDTSTYPSTSTTTSGTQDTSTSASTPTGLSISSSECSTPSDDSCSLPPSPRDAASTPIPTPFTSTSTRSASVPVLPISRLSSRLMYDGSSTGTIDGDDGKGIATPPHAPRLSPHTSISTSPIRNRALSGTPHTPFTSTPHTLFASTPHTPTILLTTSHTLPYSAASDVLDRSSPHSSNLMSHIALSRKEAHLEVEVDLMSERIDASRGGLGSATESTCDQTSSHTGTPHTGTLSIPPLKHTDWQAVKDALIRHHSLLDRASEADHTCISLPCSPLSLVSISHPTINVCGGSLDDHLEVCGSLLRDVGSLLACGQEKAVIEYSQAGCVTMLDGMEAVARCTAGTAAAGGDIGVSDACDIPTSTSTPTSTPTSTSTSASAPSPTPHTYTSTPISSTDCFSITFCSAIAAGVTLNWCGVETMSTSYTEISYTSPTFTSPTVLSCSDVISPISIPPIPVPPIPVPPIPEEGCDNSSPICTLPPTEFTPLPEMTNSTMPFTPTSPYSAHTDYTSSPTSSQKAVYEREFKRYHSGTVGTGVDEVDCRRWGVRLARPTVPVLEP